MDNEWRPKAERPSDSVKPQAASRRAERDGRLAEARPALRRMTHDPREKAILDEIEALQADNPLP